MDIPKDNSARNPLNPADCPLCGEPNRCAMAADPNATECWCESVTFPDELLAQVQHDAVRKTCICQKCLEDFQTSHSEFDLPS